MARVGVDSGSLYRRTHILSRVARSWVGRCLAPFSLRHAEGRSFTLSGSVFIVSLQLISVTSVYTLLLSRVDSICSEWYQCTQSATGQPSFAVNGPAKQNHLPPALWSPDLSESAFKQALKTHLFSTTLHH